MEIRKTKIIGFCNGVRKAIQIAENHPNSYIVGGEIIHNPHENKRLEKNFNIIAKEINENFLTIARNRRLTDKQNDEKRETGLSKKGRKVTGKKGLGKLALFGIANTIIIDSIQDGKLNSFK